MKKDLIYPELSYEIVGIAFDVFNALGWGHKELYYQRAFASELDKLKLNYNKEKSVPLKYNDSIIGRYVIDFIVDDKVIVELKVRPKLGYAHVKQAMAYLQSLNLKLAILIYFTKEGVKYRRIINVFRDN